MSENTVSSSIEIVNEEWRPVVGWEEFYEVSQLGRLRIKEGYAGERRKPGKILSPKVDGGYFRLDFRHNNKRFCVRVHRIVMEAFAGPCPEGFNVNHIDGNKLNNHLSNLEYVTPRENVLHAERLGLVKHCVGVAHGKTTLSEQDVITIRGLARHTSTVELAHRYGVTDATIRNIIYGATWSHVPGAIQRGTRKRISAARGSGHFKARITEDDVRLIRQLHSQGESHAALSRRFGLTKSGIKQVIYRVSWKHIE